MTQLKRLGRPLAAIATLLVFTGCASYYQVNDPSTGKHYFTTEVKQKDGSTMFKDAKTQKKVTIQNSEVMKITEDQYKVGKSE